MKKRQFQKNQKKKEFGFVVKVNIAEELKQDSIAHLIKDYFTLDNIRNKEMFKYDKEKDKILVSKKCLNHILKLTGAEFLEHNFDYELVDEIKVLKGE